MKYTQTIFALIVYQQSYDTSSVLYLHLSEIESKESCETSGKTSFFIMISLLRLLQDRAALMTMLFLFSRDRSSEFTLAALTCQCQKCCQSPRIRFVLHSRISIKTSPAKTFQAGLNTRGHCIRTQVERTYSQTINPSVGR